MVSLTAAQRAARKAIESAYLGTCSIIEYKDVVDEETKLTKQREVPVLESQACKLSFEKIEAVAHVGAASSIVQGVKLFLAPEIEVLEGSKIVVKQDKRTHVYAYSGKAAVYATHQEIALRVFEGWA